MRLTGCILVTAVLGICFASSAGAEEARSISPADRKGMKYIRVVFNQPEVRAALNDRGFNNRDINRRLRVLDQNLTEEQERALAQRLRDQRTPGVKDAPVAGKPSPGNAFLGATLDILTEILLIPIKILSWIIPGL